MSNKKTNLNSLRFQKGSKALKQLLKTLNLDVDTFSDSSIKKLCKGQVKQKIDVDSLERKKTEECFIIEIDGDQIDSERYNSVDSFLDRLKEYINKALAENNIDHCNIKNLSVETNNVFSDQAAVEIFVYHFVEESVEDFKNRVEEAERFNVLVDNYDLILSTAKERIKEQEQKSKQEEAAIFDAQIKVLQEQREALSV